MTHVQPRPLITVALFVSIGVLGAAWFAWRGAFAFGIYGAAVATILGGKLALSLMPPATWPTRSARVAGLRVAAVVPFFHEDPTILRATLDSIAAQTRPVAHIVVVDDGSSTREAYDMAMAWAAAHPYAEVHWQNNGGKRVALANAFRRLAGQVDVWLCVDSDTVLEPNAVREGLAPFEDPDVTAVTGSVIALNARSGLLPSLIDLRYVNAFLYERAAYSQLGSVLCVCGSLAFWRADVVADNLDDFLSQRFMGQVCTYGDDRHLTNLALLRGRVVLARRSIARTAVPERVGHLVHQQIRWGKSFFRESLWSLRHQSPHRPAWWLSLLELTSWAGFTVGLLFSLFVIPFLTGHAVWLDYLVWTTLAGYARSVHVFSVRRPEVSWARQLYGFLLAPIYGALHITLLMPLRVYSLLTLGHGAWGTRAGGVEVAMSQDQLQASRAV